MIDADALEQSVLGALLVYEGALDRVGDLCAADFRHEAHRAIYLAAEGLHAAGKAVTPLSVIGRIPAEPIADLPPVEYLARLAVGSSSLLTLADYADTLREMARKRKLIGIGEELIAAASEPNGPSSAEITQRAEQSLYGLAERHSTESMMTLAEASAEAVDRAAKAFDRGGKLAGYPTGLTDLDRIMGGLQRSDLIILAGRPAMGKTALATNVAAFLARWFIQQAELGSGDGAKGVGFFSLEMSSEQLATRILAEKSGVSSSNVRRGAITELEFSAFAEAARDMVNVPVFIDQTGAIGIAQLCVRARRMKRTKGIGALVVDYLQLMSGSGKKGENRVQEIAGITTGLKALAKELDIPIVALSQLSRNVENREDKRPRLSDLRESGAIEQDADVVMFVYREEYYLQQSKPQEGVAEFFEWEAKMEQCHGIAEAIIAKQRHGPTGTVKLQFNAELTSFSDLAPKDWAA